MNKFKAFKIILFFILSLVTITGVLAAAIRSMMDTGYKHIYLVILIMVLFNFTYIWRGKSQRNSFIMAVIVAIITSILLRIYQV